MKKKRLFNNNALILQQYRSVHWNHVTKLFGNKTTSNITLKITAYVEILHIVAYS